MKVGITHGDYNGANYEILLKVFDDQHITELFTPVIYGSSKIMESYSKILGVPEMRHNKVTNAAEARNNMVNIIDVVDGEPEIMPGKSHQAAGNAAREALERAVIDLKKGDIDVLVTAPINKDNIQSESFCFPGHTEFLEERLRKSDDDKALMMLCSDRIKLALVTTHIPLKEVSRHITVENILTKLRLFNDSLAMDFTRPRAKIAVLSLNPHAGDNSLIGTEEKDIIEPAIAKAREENIMAFGPYPADGFFGSGHYTKFDGVLAMYHDQGLIPFKMLSMENGVNFTAGLPYVRTSPDHGTAYDIAGRGIASPDSLRNAIYMAIDIVRNRKQNEVLKTNPLPKLYNTSSSPLQ